MPSTLIETARGPYSRLITLPLILAEGRQYQATIIAADGTAFTMLFTGGRDGKAKLIGSGDGQTCIGEPTFQAPQGAAINDVLNQYIWRSNGWSGGAPANGIDVPVEGAITASNFLGWTAYCPCFISLPPGSGTGYYGSGSAGGGTGGGGGGLVITTCCPDGLPTTLYLTFVDPNGVTQSLPLTFADPAPGFGAPGWWLDTSFTFGNPFVNQIDVEGAFICSNNQYELVLIVDELIYSSNSYLPQGRTTLASMSTNCSPLDVVFPDYYPPGWSGGFTNIGVTS